MIDMVQKSQVVNCRQFFVEQLCNKWTGILIHSISEAAYVDTVL